MLKKVLAMVTAALLLCPVFSPAVFSLDAVRPLIYLLNIPEYGSTSGVFSGVVYDSQGRPVPNPENYAIVCYLSIDAGNSLWVKPTSESPLTAVRSDCSFGLSTVTGGHDECADYFEFLLIDLSDFDNNPQPQRSEVVDAALDVLTVTRSEDGGAAVSPERETPEIVLPQFNLPEANDQLLLMDVDLHRTGDPSETLSEEYIEAYIDAIAPFCQGCRFYSATAPENIYALTYAKETYGLYIAITAWISSSESASMREIAAAISLAEESKVDEIIVGSEALFRGDCDVQTLIGYINYTKERTRAIDPLLPVGSSDTINVYYDNPALVDVSDCCGVNVFPLWEGVDISQAADALMNSVAGLQVRHPLTRIAVTESAWATGGSACGAAEPNETNAARYFAELHALATEAGLPIWWFSSSDNAYKADPAVYAGIEGTWGFFDGSMTLKREYCRVEPFRSKMFSYALRTDVTGTTGAAVTGLKCKAYCVDVPAVLGGYPVTMLNGSEWRGTPAFKGHTEIDEVYLPETINEIGNAAFSDTAWYNEEANWDDGVLYCGEYLIKAKSSETPDTVVLRQATKAIANYAFFGTQSTVIVFPEGLQNIGYACFEGSRITDINLPDSVRTLASWCFTKCSIQTFRSGASLSGIPDHCFTDSKKLESVELGPGVTYVSSGAFNGCANLQTVTVSPDNPIYESDQENNALLRTLENGEKQLVRGFANTAKIPAGVRSIGAYAFDDVRGMTELTVPEDVTRIYSYAFYGADLQTISIPSVSEIYSYAFAYSSLTCVQLSNELRTLGMYAFNCTDLQSVDIPGSLKAVAYGSFSSCKSLETVTIGDGVQSIENGAFQYDSSLVCVTIPDSVVSIGETAFDQCNDALTIYGCSGSAAEAYALAHDVAFVALDGEPEPQTYTVSFIANDEVVCRLQLPEGAQIEKPADPVKDGCAFVGWTPEVPASMPAQDLTFTAVFADAAKDALVSIDPATGYIGKTVDVHVRLQNNPGLVALRLSVGYDSGVLELVGVRKGDVLGGTFTTSQSLAANPYIVMWNDSLTQDHTDDGVLVTLTFAVKDTAEPGVTAITATYSRGSTFNHDLQPVTLAMQDGAVTVQNRLCGDANNDAQVNLKDVVCILRCLADWEGYSVDMTNADVDADGDMTLRDVTLIERYLAGGWNVVLK